MKNLFGHTKTVLKHKWWVFKLCCKVGLPWRGLTHDMSKFSFVEFSESVKYYLGNSTPIGAARKAKGYSVCWLHHKGRNKHHLQYWVDLENKEGAAVLPYKYAAELICDSLAAGIVYEGKNWTPGLEYDYWNNHKNQTIVNPKMDNFISEVFAQVRDFGIDKTLNKKNLKALYQKYCIDDKNTYILKFTTEWVISKKENEDEK